jgi:hypothetical protein
MGQTPLYIAASKGNEEAIMHLCKADADSNIPNKVKVVIVCPRVLCIQTKYIRMGCRQ